MSYRLDLVNRTGMFKNYANWYSSYELDEVHNNISYRISSVIASFEKIKILEDECIKQFTLFEKDTGISKKSKMINFKSPSLYEIFINTSYIILSIRIIQNSILNIISKEESKRGNKISLPSSMNDFTKKIDKFSLNSTIKEHINTYWNSNGRLLKDYRDIDEHHNFLVDKVYIDNFNDKNLIILLPDNPNVKSYKKYKFDKKINALEFLLKEFLEIEILLNSISKLYDYPEGDFHYKFYIYDNNPNNMEIIYEKNNDTLMNMESFMKNSKVKQQNIIVKSEEVNMNKFSFIKYPKFFNDKESFYKIFKVT